MARIKVLAVMAAVIAGSITATPPATADITPMSGAGFFDIVSNQPDDTLWAWRNTGGGFDRPTFTESPRQIGSGWQDADRVKFGDLDGDTYDDLISIDRNGDVRVFRNVNGTFPGGGVKVGQGWADPDAAYFADINGDGRDEIVALQPNGEVWAWRNSRGIDPSTYTVAPTTIGIGWRDPRNIYFADLDGDGRDEIVQLKDTGELWAWRNVNGLNGFPYTENPHTIGQGWHYFDPWEVKFADVNNDKRFDLISVIGEEVRAFRNVNGLSGVTFPGAPVRIASGFGEYATYFAEIFP